MQAKILQFCDGRLKTIAPADGAVAAIAALREVEICLEGDGTTMTATVLGLQHNYSLRVEDSAFCVPAFELWGRHAAGASPERGVASSLSTMTFRRCFANEFPAIKCEQTT